LRTSRPSGRFRRGDSECCHPYRSDVAAWRGLVRPSSHYGGPTSPTRCSSSIEFRSATMPFASFDHAEIGDEIDIGLEDLRYRVAKISRSDPVGVSYRSGDHTALRGHNSLDHCHIRPAGVFDIVPPVGRCSCPCSMSRAPSCRPRKCPRLDAPLGLDG
jgi:hypothetical protein